MIRLLVVDDSALMRRLMLDLFEAEGDFEVLLARDGVEALTLVGEAQPDVITLDIRMPGMDGLTCLDQIMMLRPTPVVVVSSLTQQGANETIQALELGAVDVAPKPSGALSLKMDEFGPRVVELVRAAAGARLSSTRRLAERVRARAGIAQAPRARRHHPAVKIAPMAASPRGLVIVGASTGGPAALDLLLTPLPAQFPWPIVIAQHMPATFTAALARRLDGMASLSVMEVGQATPLEAGCVYIGRGDADLIISSRASGLVALAAPASETFRWHPSVDRLTDSALEHVKPSRLVGVLMTGMGNDGAAAMTRLRAAGGRTIAESEESAVVWGMPGELAKAGGAEFILPADRIAARLVEWVAP